MHLFWPLVIIIDLVERLEDLADNPVVLLS